MINRIFCELQDHQHDPIVQLCTNKICTQFSRWICVECQNLQLHDHQHSQNHIKDINQFPKIKRAYQLYVEQFKKLDFTYLQNLKEIEDQILYIRQLISSQDLENQYINQQFDLFDGDIYKIDNDQLNTVVNFENVMIKKYTKILQILKFVTNKKKNMISGIESIVTALKEQKNSRNNLELIQEQIDTHEQQMGYQQVCDITVSDTSFSAKISPNEQLLMCCNRFHKLQIINIKQQKTMITQYQEPILDLKQPIDFAEFTYNSKSIIICTSNGLIKVYNLSSNYKLVFRLQINNSRTTNLVLINKKFILTSHLNKQIILTDLITHKQILKITKSTNKSIQGIDYDEIQQVIIIGFENQIEFYNLQGELLFMHTMKFGIYMDQLQFLKNDYLFISGNGQLFLWQINYKTKKLILINKFPLEGNYYSVFSHTQLIFIVEFCQIDVLDINFNLIQEIPHQTSDLQPVKTTFKNVKDLNFIYVQGLDNLEVIKLSR